MFVFDTYTKPGDFFIINLKKHRNKLFQAILLQEQRIFPLEISVSMKQCNPFLTLSVKHFLQPK